MKELLAALAIGGGAVVFLLLAMTPGKLGLRFGITAPPLVGRILYVIGLLSLGGAGYGLWKNVAWLPMAGYVVGVLTQILRAMLRPAQASMQPLTIK